MKNHLISSATLALGLLFQPNVWASPFSDLYVFGDSLSDAGDSPSAVMSLYKVISGCDPYHPCPPYYNGRYSNGPVAAEQLADAILVGGASPTSFFSFAIAGATTGIGNYGDGGTTTSQGLYGLPGMYQQMEGYLAMSGGAADPNALYFVWGGANDLLTADSPVAGAQNVAGYVETLAGIGATHILVPNLPDLGLTPYVQSLGQAGIDAANAFSMAFNATLADVLDSLSQLYPGSELIQFDTYAFLNDVVTNPSAYGFTNAEDSCLPSCTNPNGYVFWDDFHPTTQADKVIAAKFASAVAEPGPVALLAVGLVSLAAGRARRRVAASSPAE